MAHEDDKKLSDEELANLWLADDDDLEDTSSSMDEPQVSEANDALASLDNQATSQEAGEVEATTDEPSDAMKSKGGAREEEAEQSPPPDASHVEDHQEEVDDDEIDFTAPAQVDAWAGLDEAKKLREETNNSDSLDIDESTKASNLDYEDYVGEFEQEVASEGEAKPSIPTPSPTPFESQEPPPTSKVIPKPVSKAWDEDYSTAPDQEQSSDEEQEGGYDIYEEPSEEEVEHEPEQVDLPPSPHRWKKLLPILALGIALALGVLAVVVFSDGDEPPIATEQETHEPIEPSEEEELPSVSTLPSEPLSEKEGGIEPQPGVVDESDEEPATEVANEALASKEAVEPKTEVVKEEPKPTTSQSRRQETTPSPPTPAPAPSKPKEEEKGWQEEADKALDELESLLDF